MIGRVLDSSALIHWARQSSPYVNAIVFSRAKHPGYIVPVVTTAPAVTVALAQLPASAVPILDALIGMEICLVDDLTPSSAPGVAEVLQVVGPYAAEHLLTAASIVQAARRRNIPVTTSNPYPLTELASRLGIELETDPIP
ncbi:hypothetical protein HS041_29580 [Planomonospora sp. ID67723]|uniref:hypothetical protein n=1 Tax=Planomonospora sp. ID67723 TaxID=2738134 RepID=UPI0018C43F4A|nr:hypothetical protein [Planomonospora sp. ID67723]MBG0831865.1 hypothetical protein [Planomonospora sp. ID67723]